MHVYIDINLYVDYVICGQDLYPDNPMMNESKCEHVYQKQVF